MQISNRFMSELARPEVWLTWAERGLRVVVIIALAAVFARISRRMIAHLRRYALRTINRRGDSTIEMEKRATTLVAVMSKVATICVWLIALVMSLTELN